MKRPPEMSFRQFKEALARNGFKHAFLFWFQDTTGVAPGHSFPGVFYRGGKMARRATIAELIRARDKAVARMAEERAEAARRAAAQPVSAPEAAQL